jgi:hypothetical protein
MDSDLWNLCNLPGEELSLSALTLCLNMIRTLSLSRVRGTIRIFQVTPQQESLLSGSHLFSQVHWPLAMNMQFLLSFFLNMISLPGF